MTAEAKEKEENVRFGLLGRKLAHSFSPRIHGLLGGYAYGLFEKELEELERFLKETKLLGMNVTIPYKKAVLPFLASVSEEAKRIGSVNTLVRRAEGWHGYNTDYAGFRHMVERSGFQMKGRKGLVLGSGGASLAVRTALEDMEASDIVVISRSGPDNYDNLERHSDADFIVNTTPVGMFPETGRAAVSLEAFPNCRAVFDLIYNPARTKLMMEAEEKGLICSGGLPMLVGQAAGSADLFLEVLDPEENRRISEECIEAVTAQIASETANVILIGMPGCGKSLVGKLLADRLGRPFLDLDQEFAKRFGRTPEETILAEGENAFRMLESALIADTGRYTGYVISTGGGCVTREDNYRPLHQNGTIVWLTRDIKRLSSKGRPITQKEGAAALYAKREPMYTRFADIKVSNDGEPAQAAEEILRAMVKI